jgi:hypothetical protein
MSTPETRALQSLLDVVQELCEGLAAGQTPEPGWAAVVTETFDRHRLDLRGLPVEWPGES